MTNANDVGMSTIVRLRKLVTEKEAELAAAEETLRESNRLRDGLPPTVRLMHARAARTQPSTKEELLSNIERYRRCAATDTGPMPPWIKTFVENCLVDLALFELSLPNFGEIRTRVDAIRALDAMLLTIQTSPVSSVSFDPVQYAKKLSKAEKRVLSRYCEGVKLGEVASELADTAGAKRGIGQSSRAWAYGDTEKVIRAAKKAGYLIKQGTVWKIVTSE